MKILFLTLGNELVASSRTRVFQYLPHLQGRGMSTTIIRYQSGADYWWAARVVKGSRLIGALSIVVRLGIRAYHMVRGKRMLRRLLVEAPNHDVVFIQKVVLPAKALQKLVAIGKPIVFDFDDAIYADDSYGGEGVRRIVSAADLVVVENSETASFADSCGTASLRITGPIDCARYRPAERAQGDRVVLGWVGSGSTTVYLSQIEDPLRRICERHPSVVLRLIGAGPIDLPGVPVERFPWRLEDEAVLLGECNIGLMPLPDTPWARGKGGYKLLQYMASGLPSVCSPVGVNTELVAHGITGLHADSPEAWFESLSALVENRPLRESMGRNARTKAVADYSFEAATPILIEAMRSLRKTP